ncbi:hypothetical protein D3C79_764320 [compost metagenome]
MQVHLAQTGSVDATNLPGLLQLLRRECCVLLAQPAYECCERPLGGLLMLAAPGALPIVFQRRLPGVLCIRVDDAPLLQCVVEVLFVEMTVHADEVAPLVQVLALHIGLQAFWQLHGAAVGGEVLVP